MNKKRGETMLAYKGFDANWKCRDFQYELGKTYTHSGDAKLCESGFHACEYPLDIFSYYDPTGKFAQVELGDVAEETDGEDSKRCGKSITIKASLTIPLLVAASIEYTLKRCDPVKAQHSEGNQKASSATGYRSASSATGYSSASSATGDRSASSATGDRSASSATGDSSASSATGYSSASLTTGSGSSSEVLKPDSQSVAIGVGYHNKARAAKGCAIVLAHRDDKGKILHIRASKVCENGIKPDVWYTLNADGEFAEVA